jgi:hypothetical protein
MKAAALKRLPRRSFVDERIVEAARFGLNQGRLVTTMNRTGKLGE